MDDLRKSELEKLLIRAATKARARTQPKIQIRYRMPTWALVLIAIETGLLVALLLATLGIFDASLFSESTP